MSVGQWEERVLISRHAQVAPTMGGNVVCSMTEQSEAQANKVYKSTKQCESNNSFVFESCNTTENKRQNKTPHTTDTLHD